MKTILVIGGTGTQGSAVVDTLLHHSFSVHALVRDASKESAKALHQKGVELVEGDLDDVSSLRNAMHGVYGVYSMQNWQNWDGPNAKQMEVQAGMRVADIAQECGVAHLVYSSAGGADQAPDIEAWHGKYQVEQHIKKLGIQYTILRPVAFMDNFLQPTLPQMLSLYRAALTGKSVQLIASEDIGKWATLAFSEPQKYANMTLEIAGDQLTYDEIQHTFKEVIGRTIDVPILPENSLDAMGPAAKPLKWLHDVGYNADIDHLRKSIPDMLTFKEWLVKHQDKITF